MSNNNRLLFITGDYFILDLLRPDCQIVIDYLGNERLLRKECYIKIGITRKMNEVLFG
jgi:hypothetical protein